MEHGVFKTDDMTLATLLAIKGYHYNLEAMTNKRGLWVFTYAEDQEEAFDDLIADYQEFDYQVEPRQFVLKLAEIRSELYDLLPRPRRGRDAPAPAV